MADPVSIAASIASLISVGTKTSIQLCQFIEDVRAAPSNIRDLSKELTDLCSILKRLQTAFSNTNSQGSKQHEELSADFENVLDSCMDKFIQLQLLVKAHEIKDGDGALARKWKGWRWTFQEKEVMALKTQLEAHKATLNITLTMATYTDVASFKGSQDRLEQAAREIIEKLKEFGDVESTTGTYQSSSSFILERYLSSASSASSVFSSSPPTSPLLHPTLGRIEEEGPAEWKNLRKVSSLKPLPRANTFTISPSTNPQGEPRAGGSKRPKERKVPGKDRSLEPVPKVKSVTVPTVYSNIRTVREVKAAGPGDMQTVVHRPKAISSPPSTNFQFGPWGESPIVEGNRDFTTNQSTPSDLSWSIPVGDWNDPLSYSTPQENAADINYSTAISNPHVSLNGFLPAWSPEGVTGIPKLVRVFSEPAPPGLLPRASPPGEQSASPVRGAWPVPRLLSRQNSQRLAQPPSATQEPSPVHRSLAMSTTISGIRPPSLQLPQIPGQQFLGLQPPTFQDPYVVLRQQLLNLSATIKPYRFRKTRPSNVLQSARQILDTYTVGQDYNFGCELYRLHEESVAWRRARREEERSEKSEEYWQHLYKLLADGKIGQGELQRQYSKFEWDERQKESQEALEEYQIYENEVYLKADDKFQQTIQLLMSSYSSVMGEIPKALAGEDRWHIAGGIELTELLEIWLELWHQIEERYSLAEIAFLARNITFKEWATVFAQGSYSQDYFQKLDKEHAQRLANEKRERTNMVTSMIDGVIANGLNAERAYVDKILAAASPITENSFFCEPSNSISGTSLKSLIISLRELLEEAQNPYSDMIHALEVVELAGNNWKCKSMLADLKPTNSSVSKVQGLKDIKDNEVREKYAQELAIFKHNFSVIDASLKVVLELW